MAEEEKAVAEEGAAFAYGVWSLVGLVEEGQPLGMADVEAGADALLQGALERPT